MNKEKLVKFLILFSIIGAMLSFFIFFTDKYQVANICPTDGCAKVAASEYSYLFGVPVSIWGFLYYCFLAGVLFFREKISTYFKLLFSSALGFGILFTVYLRYIEFFKVHAICFWCWGSVLIMIIITALFLLYLKHPNRK